MNVELSEKSRVSQKKQPKSCFIINIYLTLRPKGSKKTKRHTLSDAPLVLLHIDQFLGQNWFYRPFSPTLIQYNGIKCTSPKNMKNAFLIKDFVNYSRNQGL